MLIHKGTQLLETERLSLRPFLMEDARSMYDNWASDPEVTRYLTWPAHSSPAVTEAVLRSWTQAYSNPEFYQWAIVPKRLGVPIGGISVVSHDNRAEIAHIGYCIGRLWWHQGYTSEALAAVLNYLFDEVGFQRVESIHDTRNPHSGGVMRKCGMT